MLLKSQFSSNLSQHLGAPKLEQLWQPTASQEFWRRNSGKEACHLFKWGVHHVHTHTRIRYIRYIVLYLDLLYTVIYIYIQYIYTLYLDIPV